MIRRLFASLVLVLAPLPALAQSVTDFERRAEDIVTAMRGEADYDAVFTDSFISAVPETQLGAITAQIESQFGPLVGIESVTVDGPNGALIAIRFERGLASGTFALADEEPFEVTGFFLNDIRPVGDTVEQVLDDIRALPGETGLLAAKLGEAQPLAAHNADRQFAVASTFKLYVLSALAQSIARGERDWSDVVALTERSFPSGPLRDWPEGAPITLQTLATMMISVSDNTATDQLIAVLGREAVEDEVVAAGHADPEATLPVLTTRELFLLKSGDGANLGQYAAAGTAGRLAVLQELAAIDRGDEDVRAAFAGNPVALDIEWFASPRDIARLMERLVALEDDRALHIMAVNPAMPAAMRAEWDYAGYKGGSEPGVLNLSYLLRDTQGEWLVLTLSWNNPEAPVEQAVLEMLAMRAIALLRDTAQP